MGGWNFIDRTNMRWGKLVAKQYLGNKQWLCECDCGNTTIVNSDKLPINSKTRAILSCGCNLISKKMPNQGYFKNIDTEEKAYILGFLAADGTIENNDNKSQYSIKIVVNSIDRKLLEDIKKSFGALVDIKDFNTTTKLPQGGECNSSFSSLTIHGKELVKDLNKLGVTSKKSLTLNVNYNKIPQELKRHFWRGLMDGDGTFGVYGKKKILSMNITTSIYMCETTKQELLNIFPNLHISYYQAINCNQNTKRFIITTQKDVYDFLQYIYEDSHIYLERKYKKFLEIKRTFNSKL